MKQILNTASACLRFRLFRISNPIHITVNQASCHEPLDKKIDIVEKLPHLRKIGVTPWVDMDAATEIIGKKYMVANRPNPASGVLDEDVLRKEIGRTIAACKRNGCSCDIVLKDISSASYRLENLVRWEQIAMELVNNW